MRWHWSVSDEDIISEVLRIYGVKVSSDHLVKARGHEYRISWKKAIEIARFIKRFTLKQAREYLEKVIELKTPIPIRRFTRKQAHHRVPWRGWPVAKWPIKVSKTFLELLRNLENNALYKGLDVNRVVITHVATWKGVKIRNYMPRAFGRSTPWFGDTVHIEIVGVELPEEVVPKKLKLKIFK